MNESTPREHLAAILAADVVGYSRLMRNDERTTIATLDEYRNIFRQHIDAHGGRVVDMAGDSVLAIFDSASAAVMTAIDAQKEMAAANNARSDEKRMYFRIGVNLGDILEKADGSVYGDGVNVAARIESTAEPGGVNISGSVYNSVGAKFERQFSYLGKHSLKNIEHPVSVYQLGGTDGSVAPAEIKALPPERDRVSVSVSPIRSIGGGDDVVYLAQGIHEDLISSLTKQSAIAVVTDDATQSPSRFRLDGSVRSSGSRLRFFFTLVEVASGRQVWSDRYDRELDDLFDLEDEISQKVTSAVRIRIKAQAFETLRDTDNERLAIGELLSKAAGYFVDSYGGNDAAEATLKVALEKAPENSMAHAMMVMCRHRHYEFDPYDLPDELKSALFDEANHAVALQNSSYFAHLIAALIHQDLRGDYAAAAAHAEMALSANPGFSPAGAMAGIAQIHGGEPESGIRMLRTALDEAPEDPHRFRHLRELAIGYFVLGHYAEAELVIEKLMHQAPDLLRNHLPHAAILWSAGKEQEARQRVAALLHNHPGLSLGTMRPVRFGDAGKAREFDEYLRKSGLPD